MLNLPIRSDLEFAEKKSTSSIKLLDTLEDYVDPSFKREKKIIEISWKMGNDQPLPLKLAHHELGEELKETHFVLP